MGLSGFVNALMRGARGKKAAEALVLPDWMGMLKKAASWVISKVTGNAPLTLPDAKQHTIHSLTQYGKCTQTGTPTPDAPVDIVCNNGALKYSANMANVNEQTARVGYYINAQGAVLADIYNWYYQRFIPVKPNTTYTLSMSQPVYYVTISEYSTAEDSGFIIRKTGQTGGNTSLTITTGANTNFIRFGTNLNRVVVTMDMVLAIDWMLNLGGTAMDYQPYIEGGIYTDGTPEVLSIKQMDTYDAVDGGGTYVSQQSTVSNRCWKALNLVDGNYTISVSDAYDYIVQYKNKGNATGGNIGDWTNGTETVTLGMGDETYSYGIALRKHDAPSSNFYPSTFSGTISVLHNSTPQTASVPTLLSVGDYKDEAELISGIKTGKVGIYVFTGKEAFTKGSAFYTTNTSFLPSKAGSITPICTHFEGISSYASRVAGSLTMTVNGPKSDVFTGCVYFYADRSLYATTADFQAWLASEYANGTPVIVVYPLATETTEHVTAQHLHTNAGTNVVDVTSNVDPVELEAEYYVTG